MNLEWILLLILLVNSNTTTTNSEFLIPRLGHGFVICFTNFSCMRRKLDNEHAPVSTAQQITYKLEVGEEASLFAAKRAFRTYTPQQQQGEHMTKVNA
jgi:hypothetical protein